MPKVPELSLPKFDPMPISKAGTRDFYLNYRIEKRKNSKHGAIKIRKKPVKLVDKQLIADDIANQQPLQSIKYEL